MSIAREEFENFPQGGGADATHFFEGAIHAEAMARLEHLLEGRGQCGILVGPRGTGKSTVLKIFAEDCRAIGGEVASLDVTGLAGVEFLERLAQRLGVTSTARRRELALWTEVNDALNGRALTNRPCVVIVDHLDRALSDCQQHIRRLSLRSGRHETWVLAFSGQSFPLVRREWREQADLRIELAPLDERESFEFLDSLLEFLKQPRDTFNGVAETLVAAAAGIPAALCRLGELSLLLADGSQGGASSPALQAALDELRGLRYSA